MSETKTTWAIALVDDNVPTTEEYGDYRGHVLLADDAWEQNVTDPDDGVRAYAARMGVDPSDVLLSEFAHAFYRWYRTLSVRS